MLWKKKNEASRKRKLAADDIAELNRKKLYEEECILQILNHQVEEESLEAEEKQDFTLLAEANSFWATQKTKTEKVNKLSDMIDKIKKELKGIK